MLELIFSFDLSWVWFVLTYLKLPCQDKTVGLFLTFVVCTFFLNCDELFHPLCLRTSQKYTKQTLAKEMFPRRYMPVHNLNLKDSTCKIYSDENLARPNFTFVGVFCSFIKHNTEGSAKVTCHVLLTVATATINLHAGVEAKILIQISAW